MNARDRCGLAGLGTLSQPQIQRERERDKAAKAYPPHHSRRCHCDGLKTNFRESRAKQLVLTLVPAGERLSQPQRGGGAPGTVVDWEATDLCPALAAGVVGAKCRHGEKGGACMHISANSQAWLWRPRALCGRAYNIYRVLR